MLGGYTIIIDPDDPVFISWYRRNIPAKPKALVSDVGRVNRFVTKRNFTLENFKKLTGNQQFILAAVLYALRSIDDSIASQIDHLERMQQEGFEMIDGKFQNLETRLDTIESSISKSHFDPTVVNKKVINAAIYGSSGVGVIYLISKAPSWKEWIEDNPETVKKVAKGIGIAAGAGLITWGLLKLFGEKRND